MTNVQGAFDEETAVVPAWKLTGRKMCYTTAEDYTVLNCNTEHIGSLEDHGSVGPLIVCGALLYLRDLDRDHEQVEGSVKKDRGVIRQCGTIASTVSGQEVARILWSRGVGHVEET